MFVSFQLLSGVKGPPSKRMSPLRDDVLGFPLSSRVLRIKLQLKRFFSTFVDTTHFWRKTPREHTDVYADSPGSKIAKQLEVSNQKMRLLACCLEGCLFHYLGTFLLSWHTLCPETVHLLVLLLVFCKADPSLTCLESQSTLLLRKRDVQPEPGSMLKPTNERGTSG